MKKVSLFIVAALFAVSAGFVSCSDDDETAPPVITVNLDGTDRTEITVDAGASVKVKIDYTAEAGIKQIDLEQANGTNVDGYPKTKNFISSTVDKAEFTAGPLEAGTAKIVTRITDKENRTANKEIVITVKAVATQLVDDTPFTLVYKSSSQADGANVNAAHGIKFSSIKTDAVTGVFVVEPSAGNNFVMLTNQAAYDALTTKEGLASAYTSGTGVSSFEVKSDAQFGAKFFISKVGNDYFLIKMTNLTFSPGNNVASFTGKK